jgi:hypothetical protein
MVRRGLGFVLGWAGIIAVIIGLLGSVPIFLEGFTGFIGEGMHLRQESPEEIQGRLILLGGFWSAAVVGWVFARVGNALMEPDSKPPLGVARLTCELLWLVGGIGLALGLLGVASPRAGGYATPEEYQSLTRLGPVSSLPLLLAGWVVWQLWVRPSRAKEHPVTVVEHPSGSGA